MGEQLPLQPKKLHIPKWLSIILTPIANKYILAGWGALCLLLPLHKTRNFLLQSVHICLTTPPLKWQWLPTTIVVLLLFLILQTFLTFTYSWRKKTKRNYFFLADGYSTITWKINKQTGITEKIPYCRTHQIQLIRKGDRFTCPDCGTRFVGNTPLSDINFQYEKVANRAKAIIEGHYKITPRLPKRIYQAIGFYLFIIPKFWKFYFDKFWSKFH